MYILIPNEMHDWVETQIKNGNFESPNHYVRKLIRNDQAEKNISRLLLFIQLALLQEESNGEPMNVDEVISREIKKLAKTKY